MNTATVRQIRNAFPSVLRLIRNGQSVAITSRRKVVATLIPPTAKKTSSRVRPWGNLEARFAAIQKQPMLRLSGAEMLAEERDRY
jgi:antitoxin (DNA-binding transcriptional repressor) of toxin-antitoxin stability system